MNNNNKVKSKKKSGKKSIHTDKSTSRIFTYSAIEQKRHGIAGPGKCLMIFLGIFPFVPLLLALFSCFIMKLEDKTYTICLFGTCTVLVVGMFVCMVSWIKRIFYVFILDEKKCLYRLKISNFWYKIKNQTFLLNPLETSGGRLLRLFYMVSNIKYVLENITDTVTYEELISMGRLELFTDISDVDIRKKKIIFRANIKTAGTMRTARITISRVYENDRQLVGFLQHGEYCEPEMVSHILNEIKQTDTPLKKMARFTVTWSCIIAWAAVFFLSRDFGRLSKINAGEYVKTEVQGKEAYVSVNDGDKYFLVSDYGNLYKPVLVIYGSVEVLYLISKCTDLVIAGLNKEES